MICLGLGSNLGDREANIMAAVAKLAAYPGIRVEKLSSLYETAPVGYVEQPDFLNAVAVISTSLPPAELLAVCLGVEQELGRVRLERWGPRTIDIDILLYDDVAMSVPELTLPHPRMHERCFVLAPLAEVAGDAPVCQGRSAAELMRDCDADGVRKYRRIEQGSSEDV